LIKAIGLNLHFKTVNLGIDPKLKADRFMYADNWLG
jgi:hypothetical protein